VEKKTLLGASMRKQKLQSSCYFFMVLVLMTGPMALAETSGTFTVVKGDVQVTTANGTTEKAKVGKKVLPADVITAGAQGRAKIVMSDKNIINISPDTKLAVEKYVYDPATDNKQVTLNVVYGKVRATVEQKYDGEKNKFHIKTPAAVAGVRGTDFLTSYSAKTKETKIVTFEGKVAVGSPGPQGQIVNPVFVSPGQMTTAMQGAPPALPMAVPAEEFKTMNSESQADSGKKDSTKAEAKEAAKEEKKEEKKEDKEDRKEEKKEEKAEKKEAAKADEPNAESSSTEGSTAESGTTEATTAGSEPSREPASELASEPMTEIAAEPTVDASAAGATTTPTAPDAGEAISSSTLAPTSTSMTTNPDLMPLVPTSGTMMLDSSDLAPTLATTTVMSPTMQTAMPVVNNFTPYVPPTETTQQYVNQVNQIIQNANTQSKVNVIIKRAP
jgi:hypothetical protein